MASPRAPKGLGPAASALWKHTVAEFDLRSDELPLLVAACRVLDTIERLEEAEKVAPVTVRNSRGDEVISPIIGELRQQRMALIRLQKALGITDDDDLATEQLKRSMHAKRAAEGRWHS